MQNQGGASVNNLYEAFNLEGHGAASELSLSVTSSYSEVRYTVVFNECANCSVKAADGALIQTVMKNDSC